MRRLVPTVRRLGIVAIVASALVTGCRKTPPDDRARAGTGDQAQPAAAKPPDAPAPPPSIKPPEPDDPTEPIMVTPQLAPPPPALPPAIPAGMTPTRFADAHAGQRTVMAQHIDDVTTTRTTDVVRVTAETVFVRQTVTSGQYDWTHEMTFNRYVADPAAEPMLAGEIVGRARIVVDGRELACVIREVEEGWQKYRTYTCPDVFGWVVRHDHHISGRWVTMLELLDFEN
ncbi:MAG: hypothetical protein GVY16_07010 [Planctomycetes bacterium]|jgi:hypothetical protein|nr:hypothetical protein [Planctomycetota bacterium]